MTKDRRRWLPMPHTGKATQLSRTEWEEYRRRRKQQLRVDRAYDGWWRRPSADTAERVWKVVESSLRAARIRLDDFLPGRNIRPLLKPEDVDDIHRLTKQPSSSFSTSS